MAQRPDSNVRPDRRRSDCLRPWPVEFCGVVCGGPELLGKSAIFAVCIADNARRAIVRLDGNPDADIANFIDTVKEGDWVCVRGVRFPADLPPGIIDVRAGYVSCQGPAEEED